MTRSEIRDLAFEVLYSLEIQKVPSTEQEEQIDLFIQTEEIQDETAKKYIKDVIQGITKNETEIVETISKNLKEKWEIGRISKINLALLKLATYEIIYAELPYKVVINEAVELAKKYGDENSPSFVNGILANIVKQAGVKVEE
ncbi:MAG: transcription antitermination factor NusB [Clostridia bacterium]|nr:transcription antitermination factor NusB [Clostridia bacterium]